MRRGRLNWLAIGLLAVAAGWGSVLLNGVRAELGTDHQGL